MNALGDGDQLPGFDVRVCPTLGVPEIAGFEAVMVPEATFAATEVFVVVTYPVREPATDNVSDFPAAVAGTTQVAEVETTLLPSFHWYDSVAAGDHAPTDALNVDPAVIIAAHQELSA